MRNMLVSHCTYRRETPSEKTQCQVHLTSEKVQGNLPLYSHTGKLTPETLSDLQDINQFEEKMKLCPDFLDRKMLRDQLLTNKEIIYSQKQFGNIEARM